MTKKTEFKGDEQVEIGMEDFRRALDEQKSSLAESQQLAHDHNAAEIKELLRRQQRRRHR